MAPASFGRYEVIEEIGDGAMGRVYRARDPVVGRSVAIKTVKSEYLSREEAGEYLRRFRREAQAAGVLNHPHIVSIFDVGDDYIVMEHIEGRTLGALIREKGSLTPAETVAVLNPVAEALDHAHRLGVVHRDIKPSNIMVMPDGRPKLMDFGVAHFESSVMTSTGQILGSPSYMSPEQVAGKPVTSLTDVYALGVVAYEMLTGQRPFQGSNITTVIYRIMSQPAPPPRTLNAALPTRYDDVFSRALAKDPAVRFKTAAALVGALEVREFEIALSAAIAEEAPALVLATESAGGLGPPSEPGASAAASASDAASASASSADSVASPPVSNAASSASARRPSRWVWTALGASALVGFLAVFLHGRPPDPSTKEPAPPSTIVAEGAPPTLTPPGDEAPAPPAPDPSPSSKPTAAPARTPALARKASSPAPAPSPEATPEPTPPPTPAPVENAVLDVGPGVTPPRRIAGQPVAYPEVARRLQQQGTVALSLIVNASGEPEDVQVVRSAGKALDEATLAAVRTWRFEPARKDGASVSVRWRVEQHFERK